MTLEKIPPLSRFERSPVTDALIERLRAAQVGEVVPYGELSAIAMENIHDSWHLVTSARDALLKEGVVFDVVRTVGLKRLDDDGKVAVSEGYLDKSKHAARRSMRTLRATNLEALSDGARTRYFMAEVRTGAIGQFSSGRFIKRVAAAIQSGESARKLKSALSDAIRQFGGTA